MNNRLSRLRAQMAEAGLDALLVTDRKNVFYVSGFSGTAGYLLITYTEQLLVTDSRYTEQAVKQATGFTVEDVADFRLEAFAGKGKIGFEDLSVTFAEYKRFTEKLGELSPIGRMLLNLRAVKDDAEIDAVRKACEITDRAFSHILTVLRAGMTEREVAIELEFFMRREGASGLSFDTIVASGERGSLPHGAPTDKAIAPLELVTMDFGCVYNGYCSDMTRTVGIGDITIGQNEVYGAVLSAQELVLEHIAPGRTGRQMHALAADFLNESFPGRFGHGLGHGVGLDIHEEPSLSPRSEHILVPGNIVSVEPGVYLPGQCGVRIEDLVLITPDGYENFTHSAKELIIV